MKPLAKGFKIKTNNKLRGAFGMTDFGKKTVEINKKLHRNAKKSKVSKGFAKKDLTLINTIAHEKMHVNHPKMLEKTVRKQTRKVVAKMGKKTKSKLYSKLK